MVRRWLSLFALALVSTGLHAQGSQHALEFAGAADQLRIQVDDDLAGDAGTDADLGLGDFSLELWLRGELADNPSGHAGGGVELPEAAWLDGNVILDRSAVATGCSFGVSIAGGRVRFGTGTGDGAPTDAGHTLEGSALVLDGSWHHVAVVRDVAAGEKRIYVDGALDAVSSPGVSWADLSYPDGGVGGRADNPWLYVGGPKSVTPGLHAPFVGTLDELRLWHMAHDVESLLSWHDRTVIPIAAGLGADYRMEEGAGAAVKSHALTVAPDGELQGAPSWRSYFAAPTSTAPISHGLLPAGFHREREFTGLVEPTSLVCLPDGSFLIAERAGTVYRLAGGVASALFSITADLSSIEWGIVGLALDPDFQTNGWIYLHYTTTVPVDRVSRFTLAGGAVDPASEVVLWENPALGPGHTGGSIGFGPDGKLYIPTGDAFFPPNSQDLSNPNGKILRLNPDGSLPPDNPGASIPGADPAIWAWGLRNPFRSGWDLVSGVMWIGDVGGDDGQAYEELHHGAAGLNYGWPDMEGPECQVSDCTGMTAPVFSYRHDDPEVAPTLVTGSITAGLVYRGGAFPADYDGNYFFGDYASRWIRRLRLDSFGGIVDAPLFLPPLLGGTIVELVVGPLGDLYYLTVGLPWGGGPDVASVYRVSHTPESDPTPRSMVVLDTAPSGLWVYLDGYPVRTPFAFETRQGYAHEVKVDTVQLDPGSGQTVSFSCWSDGGDPEHGIVAPAGGMNLTAGFGVPGALCADSCGFDSYGHGLGGANTLGLVGGQGASPGQTMVTRTTGLVPGAIVWVGVALNDWLFSIFGGTVLIDSFSQFATMVLPESEGAAVWSVALPSNPALVGARFYMQAMATDPAALHGLVLSNGLGVVLCP